MRLLLTLLLTLAAAAEPTVITPTSERVDVKFGMTRPTFGRTADGRKVVLKSSNLPYLSEEERRRADRCQVMASHLFVDEYGQEGLTCEPARWQEDGQWREGTYMEFLPHMRTLVEFPISRVSNPESAVSQVIYREFLGDWDMNITNFVADVETGRMFSLDFDKTLNSGFWPMKSSAYKQIMEYYATPGSVEPAVNHIASQTDAQIQAAVERVGSRYLSGWNAGWRDAFVKAMCTNRELIRANPYRSYYTNGPRWFFRPYEAIREDKGDPRVRP